jgi:hypothetical protein
MPEEAQSAGNTVTLKPLHHWVLLVGSNTILGLLIAGLMEISILHNPGQVLGIGLAIGLLNGSIEFALKRKKPPTIPTLERRSTLLILTNGRTPTREDVTKWSSVIAFGNFMLSLVAGFLLFLTQLLTFTQAAWLVFGFTAVWTSFLYSRLQAEYRALQSAHKT